MEGGAEDSLRLAIGAWPETPSATAKSEFEGTCQRENASEAVAASRAKAAALAERDEKEKARVAEAEQRATAVKAADEATAANEKLRHVLYASDLQIAESLWQANDRRRTLEVLNRQRPQAGEPDLRGFEWHFLNREIRGAARTLALPPGSRRFSPDGRRVYVGTRRTVRSWDLSTGKELPEWEPFPGEEVGFAPLMPRSGNPRIATLVLREAGQRPGPKCQLLDLEARKVLFTFSLSRRPSSIFEKQLVVLDREGRLLADLEHDEKFPFGRGTKVAIWNMGEQKVVRTIAVDTAKGEMLVFGPNGMAFHPSGKQFAALVIAEGSGSSPSSQIRVWDVHSGAEVWRQPAAGTPEEGTPDWFTLAYSPDGQYLAETSGDSDVITLRKSEDGKVAYKFRVPGVSNRTTQKLLSFSPDGSRLAVSMAPQTGVHVWDVPRGDVPPGPSGRAIPPLRSIPTDSPDSRVGFTADSRSVLLTSASASDVSYYDLGSQAVALPCPDEVRPLNIGFGSFRRPVMASAPSVSDGLAWALWELENSSPRKAEVRVWDKVGSEVFRVQCDALEVWYTGTTIQDGKRFLLIQSKTHPTDPAQDQARIQVWDMKTGTELNASVTAGGKISLMGVSPDGRTLAFTRLHDRRPQNQPVPVGENVRTRLVLWDLLNNREIHGEDIEGTANGGDMSADGSRVAWVLSLKKPKTGVEIRLWDGVNGRELWTRNVTAQLGGLEFSRDGRTLVVANREPKLGSPVDNRVTPGQRIYVLSAETGKDLRPPLTSLDGPNFNLRLSEDGRRLFARSTKQWRSLPLRTESVVVWDLDTGRKLLTLPVKNPRVSAMSIDREGRRIFLVNEVPSGKLMLETFDGTPLADEK